MPVATSMIDMSPPSDDRSVASDQGRQLFAHWFGAIVMNGMFGGVAVGILVGEIRTEPFLEWILLAIAALGPVLLLGAILETVRWARYRRVVLELDPVPGSLGGEVGGRILLPLRSVRADQCTISLSCIRVRTTSDSAFETVAWSAERRPRLNYGGGGMEASFAFEVPSDLPASNPDGSVKWAVRLVADVPGVDLDLSFPVPVERTSEPLRSSVEVLPDDDSGWGRREARIGPGIRMERDGGALVLRYGIRRSFGVGVALGLFGALCIASGGFVFRTTFRGGDSLFELLFSGVGGMFLLVFGLIGLLLSLIAVHMIFTTRRIEITSQRIRAARRFLLYRSEQEIDLDDVERIVARSTGQVGQGARASVLYEIEARLGAGGSVVLGGGIRGPAHLDRIVHLIQRETGRTVEVERRRSRLADVRAASP